AWEGNRRAAHPTPGAYGIVRASTAEPPDASVQDMAHMPGDGEPHLRTKEDVLAALGTDAHQGLTEAEATARLKCFGPNQLDAVRPVPAWRKFLAQFTEVLVLLLIVAGVISAALWFF